MKLKAPKIEIPPDNPFLNDLLGRKACAEQLTEILKTDEPLVLCINAPWGNGKTTFITMWRALLNQEGFKTLYFNAWENDHTEDALVSLIGELSAGMGSLQILSNQLGKAQTHLNQAKRFGAALVKKGLPVGIRIATGGLVDLTGIDFAEAGSQLSELAEEVAKEQIDEYEQSKKNITGFKEQLRKFADEATAPEEGKERNPIVILVDELDRCRPPYALQVLEKIKHLFNVPNIMFVIAVDKKQLAESIKSMYGQGMNTDGYLRRFIDLDFMLPIPPPDKFCTAQFTRFGLDEFFKTRKGEETAYDHKHFNEALSSLFAAMGCTLREQEHCFALLSLAVRSTPLNHKLYPFLLATLILLKIRNYRLYTEFVQRTANQQDILTLLNSTPPGRKFMEDNYGIVLEIQLTLCQNRNYNGMAELRTFYKAVAQSKTNTEAERQRAERVIELLNGSYHFRDADGCLDYLIQKIDMVANFAV